MLLRFALVVATTTCFVGSVLSATTVKPQGFSPRSFDVDENLDQQEQSHLAYRSRVYDYASEEEQEEAPRQLYQNRNTNIKQQNNYLKPNNVKNVKIASEEEEEEEEPDRLSTLLEKSQFNCNSKTTGYYADESLACEVFHYCQDNQRHSWICPEGFTFHQIHLICMPPSNDNICDQSSKYHIVNDYLYKPINLQEHQSKPNVTLRYSDRYYPENYYENDRYQEEERETRQRVHHQQRQPVQIGFNSQQRQQPQQQAASQPQPQPQPQPQAQSQYRKTPPPAQPVQLAQQQTLAPSPTPQTQYRYITQAPVQQYQQQVYRTPEEINISLQQRRPQLFAATSTPRYFEEDYLYERRK